MEKNRTILGRTLDVAWILASFFIAAFCVYGCAGFEGKRNVSLKLGILGNSVEWISSCNGKYEMESPVCK